MGKVKEILKNPKTTILMGIVGCILILIFNCFIVSGYRYFGRENTIIKRLFMNIMEIAFLIYFVGILVRSKGGKINIKMIKNIAIIGIVISTIIALIYSGITTYHMTSQQIRTV